MSKRCRATNSHHKKAYRNFPDFPDCPPSSSCAVHPPPLALSFFIARQLPATTTLGHRVFWFTNFPGHTTLPLTSPGLRISFHGPDFVFAEESDCPTCAIHATGKRQTMSQNIFLSDPPKELPELCAQAAYTQTVMVGLECALVRTP